jgi:hypothetical protein
MVGDEKREKIESYGGTSTEVYVNVCCWRKLRKWLNFEIFVVLEPTKISYGAWRQNKSVVAPVVVGPEVP